MVPAITAVLDRVNFLERTLRTSTVITPPRELDAASLTLGAIFLHPMTGYPQEANVTWKHFIEPVGRIAVYPPAVLPLGFLV